MPYTTLDFFQDSSKMLAEVLDNIANGSCTAVWLRSVDRRNGTQSVLNARTSLTDEDRETLTKLTGDTRDVEGYEPLREALDLAYQQATIGKGHERHANNKRFSDQPMQKLIDLYGLGFALGQAGKKMQEAQRMPKDRAVAELAGAIVYIAGAIAHMQNS